jgi:hypothetical protein
VSSSITDRHQLWLLTASAAASTNIPTNCTSSRPDTQENAAVLTYFSQDQNSTITTTNDEIQEDDMSGRTSSSSSSNNNNRRELCRGSIGTSFHARRWLSLDPCGCSGVLLSWSVHLYALFIIPLKITSHSMIAIVLYVAVYIPAALLAMTSLFQAWTTNPGAVPMGARPLTIVRRASSSLSAHSSISNGETIILVATAVRRCKFKIVNAAYVDVTSAMTITSHHALIMIRLRDDGALFC